MISDFFSGLALGMSLILAIGAQNVYVIRQGIRGEHVFAAALTCSIADAFLIFVGVAGIGFFVQLNPWIIQLFAVFGAAFLIFYGFRCAEQVVKNHDFVDVNVGEVIRTKGEVIAVCLSLAFLNPHVYLDTVILLGSISTQYENSRLFGLGAGCASFIFFFSISYLARQMAPIFSSSLAWRVFDSVAAVVMWVIAASLLSTFVF